MELLSRSIRRPRCYCGGRPRSGDLRVEGLGASWRRSGALPDRGVAGEVGSLTLSTAWRRRVDFGRGESRGSAAARVISAG